MQTTARSNDLRGTLLILAGGILWGIIGPFIQVMSHLGASAILISFFRMAFSFLILLVFIIVKYGIHYLIIDRRQLISAALLGLICHGIYNIFYSLAVNTAGVTISAVLLNIAPLFTAIMSVLLAREKMTVKKVIALMINVAGCMLAATGGRIDLKTFSVIGILYGLAAGFCYSMTAVLGKIAGDHGNVFVLSMYSYFFATLFLGICGQPWKESAAADGQVLLVGFLYALIPTVIAYLFYYRGVQLIHEISKVPVIASVEMIVAGILGVTLFHESLNLISLCGIACVLGSILLMNMKNTG